MASSSVKTRLGRTLALVMVLLAVCVWLMSQGRSVEAQAPAKTAKPEVKKAPVSVKTPPPPSIPEPDTGIPQVAVINRMIEEQWKENKITPSARASDYEFIRRATLDIIGRIATTKEIDEFFKDPPQARKMRLIDRLLDSEEYAANWSNIWTIWLMTRTTPMRNARQTYHEQMQLWLEEHFSKKNDKTAGWDKMVSELITATGDNNENGAVNYILSHLGEASPKDKVREEGQFQFVPITSRTARLFLGLQIQCTQCHDHPFNPQWKQKHFWGMNTFFRQAWRDGVPLMQNQNDRRGGALPKLTLSDRPELNPENSVYYETRKAVVVKVRSTFLLDNKKFDPKIKSTRRQQLAEFITTSDYFAKAYVNRTWAHFFGRGMTVNGKDFDDFGEHNAETHPELLNYLAAQFRESPVNYNHRELIRWICNSRAYGLSSVANETNDKPEQEPFFSRMLLKAMSPEQLFESLMISTYNNPSSANRLSKDDQKALRDDWMRKIVVNFGDDEGNEQTFNGTVVQALILMNGENINKAINNKGGPVASAMRRGSFDAVAVELFLATLNRKPTAEEMKQIKKDIEPLLVRTQKNGEYWEKVSQDLFWALLNSGEFILNH